MEKLEFIKRYDPEGAARLEKLLQKKDALKEGNVYREKFTDRQFFLIFEPLLEAACERARILEVLSGREDTVQGLAEELGIDTDRVFACIKELIKRNLVEIIGLEERNAVFKRRNA